MGECLDILVVSVKNKIKLPLLSSRSVTDRPMSHFIEASSQSIINCKISTLSLCRGLDRIFLCFAPS